MRWWWWQWLELLRLSDLLRLLELGRWLERVDASVQGEFDVLCRDLNASVSLRDAVVEWSDKEGRMRIARIFLLLARRGANVGHIELLPSDRLREVGRCQKDVIRSVRCWGHLLQFHKERADIDKLLRVERVSAADDQRHGVTRFHVNCRFVLAGNKNNKWKK